MSYNHIKTSVVYRKAIVLGVKRYEITENFLQLEL